MSKNYYNMCRKITQTFSKSKITMFRSKIEPDFDQISTTSDIFKDKSGKWEGEFV